MTPTNASPAESTTTHSATDANAIDSNEPAPAIASPRERHGRPEVSVLAVDVDDLAGLATALTEMAEVERECGDPYAGEPFRKRWQTIIVRKAETISHDDARRNLPGATSGR